MATASPPSPPPSPLPPSPSATLATTTTSSPTTPSSCHLPAPSLQCGVSSASSPCLEEQLLDYDSSSSLRSKTPKGSYKSIGLQVTQDDRMPSYKNVLLSSPPLELASQRPHKSREESSLAAVDSHLICAFQGSTVMWTEAASRQAPFRGKIGHTTTILVKASERATIDAKKEAPAHLSHGWQVVQHKVWRKKTLPPPPRGWHPVHEHLSWSTDAGGKAGMDPTLCKVPRLVELFKK
jgi:hypothetical protein